MALSHGACLPVLYLIQNSVELTKRKGFGNVVIVIHLQLLNERFPVGKSRHHDHTDVIALDQLSDFPDKGRT